MGVILIHPPVSKPCEPPPGIGRLCGALNHFGEACAMLDANVEGLLSLMNTPAVSSDTWTSRASRHLPRHLSSLRGGHAYKSEDRYRRAIRDLGHLLEVAGRPHRVRLGLANYEHEELSPAKSLDLIKAAENPEKNPFYPYFKNRLPQLLGKEQPCLIGFSLTYLSQALTAFAMIGFLKREHPGITLVLGGGLVTSWMSRPHWKNTFQGLVDHFVAGPGEGPLLGLICAKNARERGPMREGEHPYRPQYGALPMGEYLSPGPILPYAASSGCYWNRCSFCPERAEGNPYRAIPAEQVLSDLSLLVDRQKPVLLHLLDNAISPALMEALSEHPPGVPWYGFTRVTRHLADPDFCRALKRSGCVMLKLGLESGDQSVLDALQKGIDLEKASTALRSLKKVGIATYVYLLFGTPPESLIEAQRTLAFTANHHDCIRFLNLALFNMPLFGPEVEQVDTKIFYDGDLSLYTGFDHPKGWNRPLIRQFLDKEFKRHPAIAPILRRDPPVFTSNHAPFFI